MNAKIVNKVRPHCNFCHFLKSAKLVYCFHHFATHSTFGQVSAPSLTCWAVASFMEGWRTCPTVSCPSDVIPAKVWPRPQPVGLQEGREKGEKIHFCSLDTSYLWYNFLMNLLAILEANGLFVPPWEFSKPQDNGFKERRGNDEINNNAITLSRRKTTSIFQLGGPIITNEYLFFICLLVVWLIPERI